MHLTPNDVGVADCTVQEYQRYELTRKSSGNARPQSSQLAEPLWNDPWPEEWSKRARAELRVRKKRKKKSADGARFVELSHVRLACEKKSHQFPMTH